MTKADDSSKERGETTLSRQKVNSLFINMRNNFQSSGTNVQKVSD